MDISEIEKAELLAAMNAASFGDHTVTKDAVNLARKLCTAHDSLMAELAAVKAERDEMEAAAARVLRTWPSMDTAIAIHELVEQFAKLNAKRAKQQGGA